MNKKDALNPLADTSNKELLDNLCKWIDDNLDTHTANGWGYAATTAQRS